MMISQSVLNAFQLCLVLQKMIRILLFQIFFLITKIKLRLFCHNHLKIRIKMSNPIKFGQSKPYLIDTLDKQKILSDIITPGFNKIKFLMKILIIITPCLNFLNGSKFKKFFKLKSIEKKKTDFKSDIEIKK
ncbi:hypothetical protein BpHYR1_000740 [Brachionus plicatilis]|uniref:Transmembrane protein n=1 Tax=Brachionus plicatilis TaxID=10195 RepID=A0A3M7S3D4_BRAPC|nr:hypothetical protein BpHYR1_000740 [Brachionus plicatilis]